MSFNIARRVGYSAYVSYRGVSFFASGPIEFPPKIETFNIPVEGQGEEADKRVGDQIFEVKLPLVGEWESLSVLFPHLTRKEGASLHDIVTLGSLNTTSDEWTATAHGLATATAVRFAKLGGSAAYPTLNSGSISESTTYYVRAVDANTLKFYTSAANASADTSALNFTAGPTDTIRLQALYPLTIHPLDGSDSFTYHNAIISDMPEIMLTPTKTLLGAVTFQAFPLPGVDWSTANSIFTTGVTNVSATGFDVTAIKTLPYAAAWGSSAPWDAMKTLDGWKIKAAMKSRLFKANGDGSLSRIFETLTVTAKATPLGITLPDFLTKLKLQDTGAAQGRSLAGSSPDDLNLSSGTSVYIRIYNAGLEPGGLSASAKNELLGEQTWFATAPDTDPKMYVGTEAPA